MAAAQSLLPRALLSCARRSLLYIPGSSEKMLAKALSLGADTVCMDLEDAVAANKKVIARDYISASLAAQPPTSTERLVRINPISTELGQNDLDYMLSQSVVPDGFVLPKLEHAEELNEIGKRIAAAEKRRKLPHPIALIPIIETPTSLLNLRAILATSTALMSVPAVIFGGDDYAESVGATRTDSNSELGFARNWVLLHAAAAGIQAIDIVQKNFKDDAGLRRECTEAAQWGFTGKQLIHPAQVPAANELFAPAPKQLEWAKRVVKADAAHAAEGKGAFSLDGVMIDAPTVKLAAKLLARARVCGLTA